MLAKFLYIVIFLNLITTANLYAVKKIKLLRPYVFTPNPNISLCPEFDNRDKFAPVRDQNGHGYCWSFGATSLLEEHLCSENPSYCGKHLSVIDASRCFWNETRGLGMENEGGGFSDVFECVNRKKEQGGICLEEYAPFDNKEARCFLFTKSPECTHTKAKELYEDWVTFKNKICNKNITQTELAEEFAEKMGKIILKLEKYFPNQKELGVDFKKSINSYETSAFLKDILITKKCRDNRIPFNFKYESVTLRSIEQKELSEEMKRDRERFLEAANLKKSIAIGACVSDFSGFPNSINDECSGHALVVNAIKMENGVCMAHLRNSWGARSSLSGWYELDKVLNFTLYFEYIK